MAKKTLDDLLAEEDDMGLLDVKPATSNAVSETTRVGQQFDEVNKFIDHYGFSPGEKPESRKVGVSEKMLS
ncbi:MAG: hypothetical protein WCC64_11395, partial [Aliidongia sp.]